MDATSAPDRSPDPVRLVFAAPAIAAGEDWRDRSLVSWVILASHQGVTATPTEAGTPGRAETWCGNVDIDGLIYRVHRGAERAVRMGVVPVDVDGEPQFRPALHVATWAEPDSESADVIDARQDRTADDVV